MRLVGSLRGFVFAACMGAFVTLAAVPAQAISISIDPGPVGSTLAPGATFNLTDLLGSAVDGPVTLDIVWTDNKYLDFSSLGVFNLILDLGFSTASGTFGTDIGALLDLNGDPIPGGLLGTITNQTNLTLNQFGSGLATHVYGIRYLFSLTGADPGTTVSAATLTFNEGGQLIGQGATQAVPEPATLAVFGGGLLLGFAALRRRKAA